MATAAASVDVLVDQAICYVRVFAAPVTFAWEIPAMLELIEQRSHEQAKIILISSGSLGKKIMTIIRERGWPIHSYYIFCLHLDYHLEWALTLLDDGVDIQMFDFERDLLIRLAGDLSKKMIEQGNVVLNENPRGAFLYFECARTLAEKAAERDTPSGPDDTHRPSTKHRKILDGEEGLIAKAKRASSGQ